MKSPVAASIRVAAPSWIQGMVVLTLLLGGFLALDKTVLHWYAPDTSTNERAVGGLVAVVNKVDEQVTVHERDLHETTTQLDQISDDLKSIDARIDTASTMVDLAQSRLDSLEASSPAPQFRIIEDPEAAMGRIAVVLTVTTLNQFPGQRAACVSYLLTGAGSISDCGIITSQ